MIIQARMLIIFEYPNNERRFILFTSITASFANYTRVELCITRNKDKSEISTLRIPFAQRTKGTRNPQGIRKDRAVEVYGRTGDKRQDCQEDRDRTSRPACAESALKFADNFGASSKNEGKRRSKWNHQERSRDLDIFLKVQGVALHTS